MKINYLFLIAWKTFRHNSDKTALILELITIFCLSLCVGIILGLNAIFSDLVDQSQALMDKSMPLVIHPVTDDISFYHSQEGVSQEDKNYLNQIDDFGIVLKPVQRNIILGKNNIWYIVLPTQGQAECRTQDNIKNFTVYDITSGTNLLGLPIKSYTFQCNWEKSNINTVEVPEKIWNKIFGGKTFMYGVHFKEIKRPHIQIEELSNLLAEKKFTVINKNMEAFDYMKLSLLQKKIFNIVFGLLCCLLMALMVMNCMIFIKNRKNDWKIFYLFKVSPKYTNLIITMRFIFLFILTVTWSFLLGILVAKLSTDVVRQYLLPPSFGLTLKYQFDIHDIVFTDGLVFIIFLLSTLITIKGIEKNKRLKSKNMTGLEINNLSIAYHTLSEGKIEILKNVSFKPKLGNLTALVGISGSGKTTLLNAIFNPCYLDKEVLVNIEKTSYVTQYPNLIEELTIEENLLIFSKTEKDKMQQWCKEFGIVKILSHYPKETSVGERQRACLVRALLCQPDILIMDEPTASLDKKNKIKTIEIVKNLLDIKLIKLCLIVTHDPDVVEICDDIYELDDSHLKI